MVLVAFTTNNEARTQYFFFCIMTQINKEIILASLLLPVRLLQASSSTWPCTVSVSAVDSGLSGLQTWRTSATKTPHTAANQPPNSQTWVFILARTLCRTTHTHTPHVLTRHRTCGRPTVTPRATHCMTPTWTRSVLKLTSSSVDTYSTHYMQAHHRRALHPTCTHVPYLFEQKITGECFCIHGEQRGLSCTMQWRNDGSRVKKA